MNRRAARRQVVPFLIVGGGEPPLFIGCPNHRAHRSMPNRSVVQDLFRWCSSSCFPRRTL
jgi:hypothetical protein